MAAHRLSSFLAIFLVECMSPIHSISLPALHLAPDISTAYVEHLSERDGEHSDNKMSNHEHDHSHFTPYQDEPEPDVEQPPDAFVSTDDVSTERNVEQRPRVVQGSSRRSSIIGHHRLISVPQTCLICGLNIVLVLQTRVAQRS